MLGLQLLAIQVAPDSSPAEAPRRPATSSPPSKGFLLLVFEGNFWRCDNSMWLEDAIPATSSEGR